MDHLDPEQAAAAGAPPPLLVVAGPGAGKTTTLVARARRAVQQGRRVLVLTFSRRAAGELRRRLGPTPARARTCHSLAFWLLRRYGPPRFAGATWQKVAILPRHRQRLALHASAPTLPQRMEMALLLRRGVWPERPTTPAEARLHQYILAQLQAGAMDYDTLIAAAAARLAQEPALAREVRALWDEVLVDEAQDLSEAQLRLLAPWGHRLVLVGDPHQTIYTWRGASPHALARTLQALGHHARTVQLQANYRSASRLVAATEAIARAIHACVRRHHPELAGLFPERRQRPARPGGVVLALRPPRLASAVAAALLFAPPQHIMVLARTRRELWQTCLDLARAGQPFAPAGLPPEAVVRHSTRMAWLGAWRQALAEPDPAVRERLLRPLETVAATPAHQLARLCPPPSPHLAGTPAAVAALEELYRHAFPEGDPTLQLALLGLRRQPDAGLAAALAAAGWDPETGVRLYTVHGAKGLEAEAAVVAPSVLAEADLEELAVSYVAATRARHALLVGLGDQQPGPAWAEALGMAT